MTLTFSVPGVPQTKGSTRAFVPKGWSRAIVTNDNPKAKAWSQLISEHATLALAHSNQQPFADGPVAIEVWFFFPRPQKFLTAKWASVNVPHITRPDADKLLRCAKDALSRVVWRDDAMVVDAIAHKRYCAAGELPRAEITVTAVQLPAVTPRPISQEEPTLFGQEVCCGEAQAR